jgi:methionyl-tRNA formyltransferase
MLDWLASIQFPDGGFQGGKIDLRPVVPVTFNTGQILLGLASGVATFGEAYRGPMRKAADWLVSTQDADGCWRKHPTPFAEPGEKAYETHVAWGLFEAARQEPGAPYADAALANIGWALRLQRPNGWVDKCCLSDPGAPLTHTLGYFLRGVIEGYRHCPTPELLVAARRTADGLLTALADDGRLPGRLHPDWNAAVPWVCLTGAAQVAHCWLLLYGITGDERYRRAREGANRSYGAPFASTGPRESAAASRVRFPSMAVTALTSIWTGLSSFVSTRTWPSRSLVPARGVRSDCCNYPFQGRRCTLVGAAGRTRSARAGQPVRRTRPCRLGNAPCVDRDVARMRGGASAVNMRVLVLSDIDDWDLGARLVASGHEIVAWVRSSGADPAPRRSGVAQALRTAVKIVLSQTKLGGRIMPRHDAWQWLSQHRIPMRSGVDVNAAAFVEEMRSRRVELILCAMYPQILKSALLSLPGVTAINYHPSPLPRYARPQPVFWMVRRGETQAAITVHLMTERIDGGDILAQELLDIDAQECAGHLTQRLHLRAALLLADTVDALAAGRAQPQRQDPTARTCFGRRKAKDLELDWRWPSRDVVNLMRAVGSWDPLTARVGKSRILIYRARAAGPSRPGVPAGCIVEKRGGYLLVQTGDGCVALEQYEVAPFHGWLNRLAQRLVGPSEGARFDLTNTTL